MNPPETILVHGFGQAPEVWGEISSQTGHRSLAPTLRGHCVSSGTSTVSMTDLVDDLGKAARRHPGAVLVGYSLGGRVALRTALQNPGSVNALVLISAGPGIEDPTVREQRLESDRQLAELLEQGLIAEFDRAWESSTVWDGDPDWISERSRSLRSLSEPASLAAVLRGAGQGTVEPVWDSLGKLDLPVLLITGERDRTYCEIAARMEGSIQDCSHVVIPGAGHSLLIETPEEVAEALAGFSRLRRQAGS